MIKGFLSKWFVFVVFLAIFLWWITKAETNSGKDIKILFGMSCETTRIPISWIPSKTTFDSNQYSQELELLTKKWYNRIDMIKEFIYNDQSIKILLWEKCNLPVLRINQEESVNDIWVDHIEKRNNKLLMYWSKNWFATLISCDLWTLKWNSYIPFDTIKQKSDSETTEIFQNVTNINSTNTITKSNQSTYQNIKTWLPLKLEKKILHPQDAFSLLIKPVSELIIYFDGNWTRDRKELAAKLNIKNYRWTKEQNLIIKDYLISYITIQVETIETTDIEVWEEEYKLYQTKVVSDLAKIRGYSRKYDRWSIFQEIGWDISIYKGTKIQNIQIRNYLLTKIKTKNNIKNLWQKLLWL